MRGEGTDRAAILADGVRKAAVALGSDLHVVGSLEQQSLLQVAGGSIHVGHTVFAVVCDVLGGLVGHQAHEGHLDADVLRVRSLVAVLELGNEVRKERSVSEAVNLNVVFLWVLNLFGLGLLTWNPPVMDSLNQTCFLVVWLRYQFLMGMVLVLGLTQVSPVSMLQKTLMASRGDPWLGSTQ